MLGMCMEELLIEKSNVQQQKYILLTHKLCYIHFSQLIHNILFNVSANQSLYQEGFFFLLSMSHCLHTVDANHFELICYEKTLSRRHDVEFPASNRYNIKWYQILEQQCLDVYTL